LRTLFVTRVHIGLGRGGLQKQIYRTAECLRERGVEVVYYDPWKDQANEVDVCHFFGSFSHMYYHFERAKQLGKPVVISPVFAPYNAPLWQVVLGVKVSKYIPGFLTAYKLLGKMLTQADRVLPLHEEEARRLTKCFRVPKDHITIIPNGIDRRFAEGDPTLFKEKYGISDFVLQVGSIDPNKNQLAVIKAMADLPYTYVSIGNVLLNNIAYREKCEAMAGENVLFVGQLDYSDPLLASAYAAAKVFMLPSYSEVMPLALYEACQAGCRIIVSKNIPICNELRSHVYIADPDNQRQLKALIVKAMNSDADEKLRRAALSMPTWEEVAGQILDVYKDVINENTK